MWKKVLGIVDKILGHFTPESIRTRRKEQLKKLKKQKADIQDSAPTYKSAKYLEKIEQKITELEMLLTV